MHSLFSPDGMRDAVKAQSRPFHAYNGSGEYIFISYAHRSADRVYPVIEDLYRWGYNVWYDQGIPNFTDLQDEIFRHIEGCKYFVMFASAKSLESPYVRLEIEHAYQNKKKIVCIQLKPVDNSIADPDLLKMLEDCKFLEPEELQSHLTDNCRDKTYREQDTFMVDASGGEIVSLTKNKEFNFILENGFVKLKDYIGSGSDVTVPAVYDGYIVTTIGAGAFEDCTSLKIVTLEYGISIIEACAFKGCKNLKEVDIPESVTKIGEYAFYHCSSMTRLKLPNDLETVSDFLCDQCYRLREVILPENMKSINSCAFWQCDNIKKLVIPPSVTDLRDFSLGVISKPTIECVKGSVAWGWAINKKIDINVLSEDEMKERTKPLHQIYDKEKPEGKSVFYSPATGEKYALVISTKENFKFILPLLTELYEKGYQISKDFDCIENAKLVIMFVTQKSLSDDDFCFGLDLAIDSGINLFPVALEKGIEYPDRYKEHFAGKFVLHQEDLTAEDFTYNIEATLTKEGCRGRARNPKYAGYQVRHPLFNYNVDSEGVSITWYRGEEGEVTVPSEIFGMKVTRIGEKAFRGRFWISRIILPESIVHIEKCAFTKCEVLEQINIPNSVRYIKEGAFSDCVKLNNIVLPSGITYIEKSAFSNCESLTDFVIQEGIKKIEDEMFSGCKNLAHVSIPRSVMEIGSSAFRGCINLISVEIPDSVTKIGNNAFGGCKRLHSVDIPDSVVSFGTFVFYECTSLRSVSLPRGMKEIPENTFELCREIQEVNFPESLTTIGFAAFRNCDLLGLSQIPQGVKNIKAWAFERCTSITSITIPDSVTDIGDCAFKYCTSLCTATISDNVSAIGIEAFSTFSKKITIYGSKGSFAHKYARANKLGFKIK